jgi:hypothetical protein
MNPRARSVYFSKSIVNLLGPVPEFRPALNRRRPRTLHGPAKDMGVARKPRKHDQSQNFANKALTPVKPEMGAQFEAKSSEPSFDGSPSEGCASPGASVLRSPRGRLSRLKRPLPGEELPAAPRRRKSG